MTGLRLRSPGKCSGGSAQLRTLEGILAGSLRDLISTITTVNLNRKLGYLSSQRKLKFFKDAYCQTHSVLFLMTEWDRMFFAKRQLQNTKSKNTEINCETWPFPRVKTMLGIPGVNTLNVNVSVTVMAVQFANRLL